MTLPPQAVKKDTVRKCVNPPSTSFMHIMAWPQDTEWMGWKQHTTLHQFPWTYFVWHKILHTVALKWFHMSTKLEKNHMET